jgi:hypothetical protein
MVFENGVKNIQAAAYNGAHTVYGHFPIQYILYGHSIPMDILPYGHFLIHQICMDISLLWTICHMVFLHIDRVELRKSKALSSLNFLQRHEKYQLIYA